MDIQGNSDDLVATGAGVWSVELIKTELAREKELEQTSGANVTRLWAGCGTSPQHQGAIIPLHPL